MGLKCGYTLTFSLGLVAVLAAGHDVRAQDSRTATELPAPTSVKMRTTFTMDSAIVWALGHNPELAAIRQRHGIAAAGVVIARTYPFNPVLETEVRHNGGPE